MEFLRTIRAIVAACVGTALAFVLCAQDVDSPYNIDPTQDLPEQFMVRMMVEPLKLPPIASVELSGPGAVVVAFAADFAIWSRYETERLCRRPFNYTVPLQWLCNNPSTAPPLNLAA